MDRSDNIKLAQSGNEVSLHTPGQSSYLWDIRTTVCALARRVGFPEEEVAKIEMAVDEACSNIIQHAYATEAKWCWQHRAPEIRLNMRVENNQLIVEINDHGQTFDYTAYFPDRIDERLKVMHSGGYGISIIRQFMDEIGYATNDTAGNTLRLAKRLPTRPPPPFAEFRPSSGNERPKGLLPPTQQETAARAYELYVQHGREDGHDIDDWLQAEDELPRCSVEMSTPPQPLPNTDGRPRPIAMPP